MKFRQSLFWERDSNTMDTFKDSRYIIERILEWGKDEEVKWLYNFYRPFFIKTVVSLSDSLSPKTKNSWTLLLQDK
ncbi:MAG: hypothetical protein AAB777_01295 [Patescibacteria group bacterium]